MQKDWKLKKEITKLNKKILIYSIQKVLNKIHVLEKKYAEEALTFETILAACSSFHIIFKTTACCVKP